MNSTLLCISNDKSFFFLCKVTFADCFEFLFVQHNLVDVFYDKTSNVCGVLISDEDVSPEQMRKTIAFLQKIYKGPICICTKRDDTSKEYPVHNVVVINENFKKNILSEFSVLSASKQKGMLQVASKNTLESQGNYPKKSFRELISKASNCDRPVLLLGETGSGKNFTARHIHSNSSRKAKSFTGESLSNINPGLVESTLFGTTYGAFTDAEDKEGLLESAKDGTLFLDEIGMINLTIQGKLLRFLDTGTFRRLGSQKEITCNARLIFATSEDLLTMKDTGQFHKGLFYRISAYIITIPPLRERKDEIEPLAVQFAADHNKKLSPEAINRLKSYSWPGNIRELKNCIESSSSCASNEVLSESDIIIYSFS